MGSPFFDETRRFDFETAEDVKSNQPNGVDYELRSPRGRLLWTSLGFVKLSHGLKAAVEGVRRVGCRAKSTKGLFRGLRILESRE